MPNGQVPCPICENEVDVQAVKCPSCGFDLKRYRKMTERVDDATRLRQESSTGVKGKILAYIRSVPKIKVRYFLVFGLMDVFFILIGVLQGMWEWIGFVLLLFILQAIVTFGPQFLASIIARAFRR